MGRDGICFAGQLEETEYRALMRAARPAFLKLLPWLILVSLMVVLMMGGARSVLASPAEQIPRVIIGLFLVGMLFVAPEMTIRASWKKNPLAQEPVSGAVTNKGIRWEGGSSRATFSWSALRGFRERKGLLLLYTTGSQAFWLLPRFFAAPGDWERARDRIVGNLRRR